LLGEEDTAIEHLEMVKLLLEHGASIDMPYYHDKTLLDLALEQGSARGCQIVDRLGC